MCVFAVEGEQPGPAGAEEWLEQLRTSERRRRRAFASPLHRAADAYLVRRGNGSTVIAGYHWFTDWGRDTMISLEGLTLATGRHAEAGYILRLFAHYVQERRPRRRRCAHLPSPAGSWDAMPSSGRSTITSWQRSAGRRAASS